MRCMECFFKVVPKIVFSLLRQLKREKECTDVEANFVVQFEGNGLQTTCKVVKNPVSQKLPNGL